MGHPRGVVYLAATEFWERFSYYGMSALVVLYMVRELLLPGRIEQIAGMSTYRGLLEAILGPLTVQALAYQTFGLYSGLVYLTPLAGGLVADRFFGTRRTVMLGALLMSAGHFAMAFDRTFLIALLLLIAGSGCLKGNISAQVGELYPEQHASRRTQGFALFTMAVNLGAVCGPLVCALLAQIYGWHVGFAAAGLVMLSATIVYAAGQPYFPDRKSANPRKAPVVPTTVAERRRVMMLTVVIAMTVLQNVSQFQFFSAGFVWLAGHADLSTPLGHVPVPWFLSISSLAGVVAVPPLVIMWSNQQRRGTEPTALGKIVIGSLLFTLASALLALPAIFGRNDHINIGIPLLAYCVKGVGFIYFWPTLLALVSAAAPPRFNATLVGGAFVSLFLGNIIGGWVGHYYELMSPSTFWLLNAGIGAAGTVLIWAGGKSLTRALS